MPNRRLLLLISFILVDLIVIGAGGFCVLAIGRLPRLPDDPSQLELQPGLTIYAHSGELLYTYNRRVRRVGLSEVSPHFINALLATEDSDFYHHHGFSVRSIFGAVRRNFLSGGKVRGGSTLTQQIVKNLFLTRDKTYVRKIKEILLSAQLESLFQHHYGEHAKEKLLELYINGIFFGANAYGVEDAALTYFDKPAADLTLTEAAVLAGLPNAPSALTPLGGDSLAARARTDHVLHRMHADGYITQTQLDSALVLPIVARENRLPQNRTPYFVETIKSEIVKRWGRGALHFGGLIVYTTLDLGAQQAAERAIAEGLLSLDEQLGFAPYDLASPDARGEYVQVALVCIEPATGYVKAIVGGRDIFVSYYNRATTAKRQPGSGFKPFVYLSAFSGGHVTPLSLFIDEPRTYTIANKPWEPKNYGDRYLGLTTAAWALINSANATTAQVVQRVGPENVVSTAKRLGIQSPIPPYPSIALGSAEVTPLELAAAYTTLANYGVRIDPTFIARVVDLDGRDIYRHQVVQNPVVDPADAYVITRLLQNVIDIGTGRSVRSAGFTRPAAGKTGTTNDNTDAWFTGYTPDLVTSVWVGFDSRDSGKLIVKRTGTQVTGGRGAAPIWTAFMKEVTRNTPSRDFWIPDGIAEVTVDARTGISADEPSPPGEPVIPITIAVHGGQPLNSTESVAAFQESAEGQGRPKPPDDDPQEKQMP